LFRYIRYNALGLRRAAPQPDDETAATAADVKRRKPPRAKRLGTLDPETSSIVWQDDVVDAAGAAPLGVEISPANPFQLAPEQQIESA
jgi:hypothetical protein